MNIEVNGEVVDIAGEMTVDRLLVERKVKMPDMVSVSLNGQILERARFGSTPVKGGDKVEFMYFMGGGAAGGRSAAGNRRAPGWH